MLLGLGGVLGGLGPIGGVLGLLGMADLSLGRNLPEASVHCLGQKATNAYVPRCVFPQGPALPPRAGHAQ